MHVYIYDNFTSSNKYSREVAKIETRLTDLGLNGKICRIGLMQNLNHTIETELERGAKTIIVVGNDDTFIKAISSMADSRQSLGYIPLTKNNSFAESFGIGDYEQACDILASRRIKTFDLGQANNNYFLANAKIDAEKTFIEIDSLYTIEPLGKGEIKIENLITQGKTIDSIKDSEQIANKLELHINIKEPQGLFSKKINQTIIPFQTLKIHNPVSQVILDNSVKISSPVEIKISQKKINIIVGKDRSIK